MKKLAVYSLIALAAIVNTQANAQVSVSSKGVYANGVSVDANGDIKVPQAGVSVGTSGITINSTGTTANTAATGASRINTNTGSGRTIVCDARNPNPRLNGTNQEFTVTGNCASISVTGTNVDVTAQSANKILVNGVNIDVRVNKVNSITLNGTNSTVSYKRSMNGKVAQSVRGTNTSIETF